MGDTLNTQEIDEIIQGLVKGTVPDYQMSALLMAIFFQGMSPQETTDLTMSMVHSGDTVDLSSIPGIKVDKHSTGGVGDTTSLILAPLVAACGAPVAKMSGRGLGHTGGTIDKLESLPGICMEQSIPAFISMVKDIGLSIIGQSGNLVPADKIIYALRDVTATVDSIPLIASSVMSKKIAAGSDAIVLDVKAGSGAFMKTQEDAVKLAELMVKIGELSKRKTVAIVTDMNQPLGSAIGNELELKEAIDVLRGDVPLDDPLVQISLLLGRYMLLLANVATSAEEADAKLTDAIRSGAGLEKLRLLIRALGNDASCIDHPEQLGNTKIIQPVLAQTNGYIAPIEAMKIGQAAQMLGAGRSKKEDPIDYQVGIIMHVRTGQFVDQNAPLYTVYANDAAKCKQAEAVLQETITISQQPQASMPMVLNVVE